MSSKSNSKAPSQAAKPKSGIDEPKAPKKGEDDGNLKGRTSPQAGSDKGRKNSQADDINNDDVENERENDGGDLGDREEEEQGNDEDNENREEVDDREPGEEEEEEEGEREDHERDEGEIERDRNGGEREGDDEEELVTKEDPETEIHPLPEADGLPDDNEGKINFLLDRLELTEKALRELQQYLVEEKEINANLRMKILEQEDEIKKFKDDENNTLKEKIGTVLKSTFETSVLQKVEAEKREILALQNATEKNLMILELDSQVLQIRGEFFMQQKELEDAKHEISKLREQLENLEKENGELSTDRQQKHQRINELTEENSELFATLQKMKDVQNVLNRLLGDRKTKEELINAANYEGNEVRSAYSTERADQPVFLTEKEAPVQPTRLGQGNARNPPSRKGYSQDIGSNPIRKNSVRENQNNDDFWYTIPEPINSSFEPEVKGPKYRGNVQGAPFRSVDIPNPQTDSIGERDSYTGPQRKMTPTERLPKIGASSNNPTLRRDPPNRERDNVRMPAIKNRK